MTSTLNFIINLPPPGQGGGSCEVQPTGGEDGFHDGNGSAEGCQQNAGRGTQGRAEEQSKPADHREDELSAGIDLGLSNRIGAF